MNIPDLRNDPEITVEHCSVLLEKLGTMLELVYDDPELKKLASEANPVEIREVLAEHFSPRKFREMFRTDLGKGVLIGVFFQGLFAADLDSIVVESEEG